MVTWPNTGEVLELFFPPGSEFDAYKAFRDISKTATTEVQIADNHIDSRLLALLGEVVPLVVEIPLKKKSDPHYPDR